VLVTIWGGGAQPLLERGRAFEGVGKGQVVSGGGWSSAELRSDQYGPIWEMPKWVGGGGFGDGERRMAGGGAVSG